MKDTIRLHWYSLKRVHAWEYGHFRDGTYFARRHRKNKIVQFQAMRGGYGNVPWSYVWLRCDPSWDSTFIPLPTQPQDIVK